MSHKTLVKVEHLSRHFGSITAVSDISFSVARGEVVGLLGPNGAGKSTTMKTITGNLAPSTGKIQICEYDLLDAPKQAKLQIGYLPEHPPLHFDSTVDEYLNYCARLNRIPSKKVKHAVERAKQRCGLEKM